MTVVGKEALAAMAGDVANTKAPEWPSGCSEERKESLMLWAVCDT